MSRFKSRFAGRFLLRFHMTLILGGLLAASLLCNRLLLNLGFNSMFARYPLNVMAGYSAFFLLIRFWLVYIRYQCGRELHQIEFAPPENVVGAKRERSSWLDGFGSDPGLLDETGCALVLPAAVLVFIVGGLVLLFEAPVLLTEIAASFFLAGSLSRPLRAIDSPQWAGSIFRLTWKKFAVSLMLALLMALSARILCPKAHTVTEVVRKCF